MVLATIASPEENLDARFPLNKQTAFIGAIRHGTGTGPGAKHWRWADGAAWGYANWARGEAPKASFGNLSLSLPGVRGWCPIRGWPPWTSCCGRDLFTERATLETALLTKEKLKRYEELRGDWFRFSLVFGVVHGCTVTQLSYASTLQGARLANISLATLYFCYTVSALCLADDFVRKEGPLRSVLAGLASYLALGLSYALYAAAPGWFTSAFVVACAVVAGAGGGLIWVAQSTHFARTAYDAGGPAPIAFASSFAFWYITLEGVIKLTIACILVAYANLWVAISVIFLLSFSAYAVLYLFPERCGFEVDAAAPPRRLRDFAHTCAAVDFDALTAVARAHAADRRIPLLSPQWLAFGFSSSVFTSWFCGKVSEKRDEAVVGFASATLSFVAGAASPLLGRLASSVGRGAPVAVAVAGYGALCGLMLGCGSIDGITSWGTVWVYAGLQGVARSAFEGTAKMIVVEQFKGNATQLTNRAMASVYFHMGVSSMVTFLCLEVAQFGGLALTFGGFAVLLGAGYVAAEDHTARLEGQPEPPPPAPQQQGLA
ncbi:hypothetical protein JL721_2807 [Aureococcus anophagefferens]|nr:hypothetical protein JL721_2807 [Aureococcus anophagefferens]